MEVEHDIVKFALLAQKSEVVLKMANEDTLNSKTTRTITRPKANPGTNTHLLLAKLKISTTYLNVLGNFSEVIQSSHAEKQKNYNDDKQGTNSFNQAI